MSDYVTLMGAEQVSSAARTMSQAASDMQSAASQISDALFRHQMFLDDWLMRLQQTMEAKSDG